MYHPNYHLNGDVLSCISLHSLWSFKRSLKAKTLAFSSAVKVSGEPSIDHALLFQRLLVVSQSGDISIDAAMKYELCPYPPFLFEARDMRKADKPQLTDSICKHALSESAHAVLDSVPETDHYVLDGGSLSLVRIPIFWCFLLFKALYFRSDTSKDTKVYDINVLSNVLGSDVSKHLLFAHAFTGCDTTSRIYGMGKKPLIQKLIRGDPVLVNCAVQFCKQNQSIEDIAEMGQKAIVALVGGKDGQSLHFLCSSVLTRKVISSKAFVKPEKLPPTSGAMKYHSLRTYLQVITWMRNEEGMDATDWRWRLAIQRASCCL